MKMDNTPPPIRNLAERLGWTCHSSNANGKPKFEGDEHNCYREILQKVKDILAKQSELPESNLEELIQTLAEKYGPKLDCWNHTYNITNRLSWPGDKSEIISLLKLLAKRIVKNHNDKIPSTLPKRSDRDALRLPDKTTSPSLYSWSPLQEKRIENSTLLMGSGQISDDKALVSFKIGSCICKHTGSCGCADSLFTRATAKIREEWSVDQSIYQVMLILSETDAQKGSRYLSFQEGDDEGFRAFLNGIAQAIYNENTENGRQFIAAVDLR